MNADMIGRARSIAERAQLGQVDKLGEPFLGHVRRVAEGAAARMASNPQQELAVTVAWLHDVVEDTDTRLDEIRAEFGDRVADAVDAITHRQDESRADYYRRVKADELAREVKLADIADNSDPARLARINDSATRERLRTKYQAATEALR